MKLENVFNKKNASSVDHTSQKIDTQTDRQMDILTHTGALTHIEKHIDANTRTAQTCTHSHGHTYNIGGSKKGSMPGMCLTPGVQILSILCIFLAK